MTGGPDQPSGSVRSLYAGFQANPSRTARLRRILAALSLGLLAAGLLAVGPVLAGPTLAAAAVIWLLIAGQAALEGGDPGAASTAFEHGFLEFAELFFF